MVVGTSTDEIVLPARVTTAGLVRQHWDVLWSQRATRPIVAVMVAGGAGLALAAPEESVWKGIGVCLVVSALVMFVVLPIVVPVLQHLAFGRFPPANAHFDAHGVALRSELGEAHWPYQDVRRWGLSGRSVVMEVPIGVLALDARALGPAERARLAAWFRAATAADPVHSAPAEGTLLAEWTESSKDRRATREYLALAHPRTRTTRSVIVGVVVFGYVSAAVLGHGALDGYAVGVGLLSSAAALGGATLVFWVHGLARRHRYRFVRHAVRITPTYLVFTTATGATSTVPVASVRDWRRWRGYAAVTLRKGVVLVPLAAFVPGGLDELSARLGRSSGRSVGGGTSRLAPASASGKGRASG